MQKEKIQQIINNLDNEKIHIVFFINKVGFFDIFKDYLKVVLKIYNFFAGEKIDHTAHISRFVPDGKNKIAKVFEATVELGMQQNDLFDRIEAHKGSVIIETLNKKVNKTKAKAFEKKYYGKPYSKTGASLAGLDGWFNRFKANKNALFCSYLTCLFLQEQGFKIDNPQEMTPTDLFNLNLGIKILINKK